MGEELKVEEEGGGEFVVRRVAGRWWSEERPAADGDGVGRVMGWGKKEGEGRQK